MRPDNLIIVVLGLASTAFAVLSIVWWGGLPVRAAPIALMVLALVSAVRLAAVAVEIIRL